MHREGRGVGPASCFKSNEGKEVKTVIQIHKIGTAKCSFSGKESEGAWCSFDNGSIKEAFLSWVSLRKLSEFQYGDKSNDDREGSERKTAAVTG